MSFTGGLCSERHRSESVICNYRGNQCSMSFLAISQSTKKGGKKEETNAAWELIYMRTPCAWASWQFSIFFKRTKKSNKMHHECWVVEATQQGMSIWAFFRWGEKGKEDEKKRNPRGWFIGETNGAWAFEPFSGVPWNFSSGAKIAKQNWPPWAAAAGQP